jgi:hypothetical protein
MPSKKAKGDVDRETVTPTLLPAQRALLGSLCLASDDAFVEALSRLTAWRCELVGDLYHWSGVLDRLDSLLVGVLREAPEVLCDGGGGGSSGGGGDGSAPPPQRLYAASERAVHCLRFTALLLRHCSNRRMYSSHRLLGAFCGARLCAVADAALGALLALLEPCAAFYGAREEEDMAWVEQDRALRERLAPLAEPWEGCAHRPLRRGAGARLGTPSSASAMGALRRYSRRVGGEGATPAGAAAAPARPMLSDVKSAETTTFTASTMRRTWA